MSGRLQIDGETAATTVGESLFRIAEGCGVHVPTSCREQGRCRECLVEIRSGESALSPPTEAEAHLEPPFRLACQTRLLDPTADVRCQTMRRGTLRIETEHSGGTGASLGEGEPLFTRHGESVRRDGIPFADLPSPLYGLAVDLGTTTVVVRLVDLERGVAVATRSFENPQRFGGSDVMARIQYDTDHPGRLLQRVLLGYLRRTIQGLPCDGDSIVEIAVAANPTMRDLLFGLDVATIGQLPYRSITEHDLGAGRRATTSLEIAAGRLRLPVHPEAHVYGLPLLGSHVGADAAACLLATGLAERDEIGLCMDLGTNTELLLGNRDRVLAASCPAGPAFEGGGVLCGMPALDGAVERVRLDAAGRVEIDVVGGAAATGICGSGLVDLLGELRRTGRMNPQGRLLDGDELSTPDAFALDDAGRIRLTEADVNELAQAKGANAAGARIVADVFGVALADVDRFYLAGGFGRHLDAASAKRIGLIPDLADERIVPVGNAALAGATMALVSRSARQRIERLARRVEHVELELHPLFFDAFVDGCQLQPFGGGTS